MPVPGIEILKGKIMDALAAVTKGMLENTWQETENRFDSLRATDEAHVGASE